MANDLVTRVPASWRQQLRPAVFVGSAALMLGLYLIYPALNTIYTSLSEDVYSLPEVVPEQYWASDRFAVTDPTMRIAFRNNLIWPIVGTGGSVVLGLLVATLVDRVKREARAKSFIFMPLAISFVGASVIWRFVYAWQPPTYGRVYQRQPARPAGDRRPQRKARRV